VDYLSCNHICVHEHVELFARSHDGLLCPMAPGSLLSRHRIKVCYPPASINMVRDLCIEVACNNIPAGAAISAVPLLQCRVMLRTFIPWRVRITADEIALLSCIPLILLPSIRKESHRLSVTCYCPRGSLAIDSPHTQVGAL
jgi:hypothetical protein